MSLHSHSCASRVAPASIAAPRALIGLGAATTRGGVPCGLPSHHPPHTPSAPAREGAEGDGPAPHGPARRRCLAQSQRYSASPRVTERSAVLQNRSCRVGPCGWGGGRGRKGAPAPLPGGSRGSTLPMEGRGAWPPQLFGGSGKPSLPRVFPTTINPRPEIELGPGLASLQKWKSWYSKFSSSCARGFLEIGRASCRERV